ncbi:ABC transporter substrate-binding protein [Bacillus sp. V59.32b]|uniref:ABC transporter substrate-binding protein n=1 Tax=Bacillus sp. V59.32b TaxID=1758642 RepID=UPI0020B16A8B|nr:ABC transporter substrate-binding protein [Bacillus sp. V59.32b]
MNELDAVPDQIPAGMIYVVDPSPLNWLFVLFNTMEEPVRANPQGNIIPSLATEANWLNPYTLELRLRKDVFFHDGTRFTSKHVKENFEELQRWTAPHPPGTWLNFHEDTRCEVIDNDTVHFIFPSPDGLAVSKMRAFHIGNELFWNSIGFGYARNGSGEGHW